MARALVLAGFGINCEAETRVAFERAGASACCVHVNDLIADPAPLSEADILAVPGGFSFGDDVASGRILANRLRHKLAEPLQEFVAAGKLAIGICNGFQVLVKLGILPLFEEAFKQEVTLTHNDSDRFEDRWVNLAVDSACESPWLAGIETIEMPVRHGEGKFIPADDATLERLRAKGQIALRYATVKGEIAKGAYPANPNGSVDDIAGITDPSGRILGLMPHPEAYLDFTNHPTWTRREERGDGEGLKLFRNAVAFVEEGVGAPT